MSKKDRIRLVRILIFGLLFAGGVAGISFLAPKIKNQKKPKAIKEIEEKIKGSEMGKMALKVLGEEVDKEEENKDQKDEEGKENEEEEEEKQTVSETVQEKIKEVIREKSSEKIIEILKTLPPEEFEKLKKDLQEEICE